MRLLPIALSLLIWLHGMCEIRGVVVDAKDESPIAGASVRAFGSDSAFIAGVMTGPEGEFSLAAPQSAVGFMEVSCIGYSAVTVKPDLSASAQTIRLAESSHVLADITVIGENRSQNATSETIYLTDSIRGLASNAAMMIGSLPGFKADWISESISIGNDKDVPIMVNGREMGLQYAKSINPKRIKSIEIQRYPPGRFSDYPVLVNIVLYPDYTGWDITGGFVGKASALNRHSNTETPSVDATLSARDWSLYMSGAYDRKEIYEASSFHRLVADKYAEESLPADKDNPNESKRSSDIHFSAGADKKFGSGHTVSAQTWIDKSRLNGLGRFDMPGGSHASSRNKYSSANSVTGIFYTGSLSGNLEARSSLQYNYYGIDELRSYSRDSRLSVTRTSGRKDYLYFFSDLTCLLGSKWAATAGYSFTWREYRNTEEGDGGVFTSNEKRHKADATLSFRPAPGFNIRLGGSMLSTSERQGGLSRSRTNWQPRLQLYWRAAKQVKVNAVYLSEIYYPNLDQLSTSQWEVSSHVYQTGNPSLRSRILHYANLKVTLFDDVSLQYLWKKSANDIVEWYEMMSAEDVKKTFVNCDYLSQYAGAAIDKRLGGGLRLNFEGSYQWHKRWGGERKRTGRTWYGDLTLTWAVGQSGLTLLGEYLLRHDREPLLQGSRYSQQESLALGCNCRLFGGKVGISAVVAIPVELVDKKPCTKIDIPGFESVTTGDDRVNSFLAQLNVRFNFGKGKVKKSSNSYNADKEK